ncbi:MAG: AbrB/MazE/SpoVT family DNA-binding domain-containing protein [Candidatus Binataceae bacterium]
MAWTFTNIQPTIAIMTARLTLDKLGRIVIPKAVRDRLQLSPGDEIELETVDEKITLRPLRGVAPLRKKRGVRVYRSGQPLPDSTVQRTIEQVRRERDERNLGSGR